MSRIRVILWDIDGTLLDFIAAEKCALRSCFAKFGMGECTEEMIARYSGINRKYWERLERGEITKPQVLEGRFREFFATEGLEVSKAEAFNAEYQVRLGDTVVFRDDAYGLVKGLRGQVKQYAVTNGTITAQERKLKNSGLDQLLDGVFISDQVGYEKPGIGFFNAVFSEIGSYGKEEVMIVGDSLTSDIRGGNQAGILCCWYNPQGQKNDRGVRVDYEISNLQEVRRIISE